MTPMRLPVDFHFVEQLNPVERMDAVNWKARTKEHTFPSRRSSSSLLLLSFVPLTQFNGPLRYDEHKSRASVTIRAGHSKDGGGGGGGLDFQVRPRAELEMTKRRLLQLNPGRAKSCCLSESSMIWCNNRINALPTTPINRRWCFFEHLASSSTGAAAADRVKKISRW